VNEVLVPASVLFNSKFYTDRGQNDFALTDSDGNEYVPESYSKDLVPADSLGENNPHTTTNLTVLTYNLHADEAKTLVSELQIQGNGHNFAYGAVITYNIDNLFFNPEAPQLYEALPDVILLRATAPVTEVQESGTRGTRGWLDDFCNGAKAFVDDPLGTIGDSFSAVGEAVSGWVDSVASGVITIVTEAGDSLQIAIDGIATGTKAFVSVLEDATGMEIGHIVNFAIDAGTSYLTVLIDSAQNVISTVIEGAKNAADVIIEGAYQVGEMVLSAIEDAADFLQDLGESLINEAIKFLNDPIGYVVEKLHELAELLTEWIDNFIKWVINTFLQPIINALNGWVEGVEDTAVDFLGEVNDFGWDEKPEGFSVVQEVEEGKTTGIAHILSYVGAQDFADEIMGALKMATEFIQALSINPAEIIILFLDVLGMDGSGASNFFDSVMGGLGNALGTAIVGIFDIFFGTSGIFGFMNDISIGVDSSFPSFDALGQFGSLVFSENSFAQGLFGTIGGIGDNSIPFYFAWFIGFVVGGLLAGLFIMWTLKGTFKDNTKSTSNADGYIAFALESVCTILYVVSLFKNKFAVQFITWLACLVFGLIEIVSPTDLLFNYLAAIEMGIVTIVFLLWLAHDNRINNLDFEWDID
jgi:hypothetical protein